LSDKYAINQEQPPFFIINLPSIINYFITSSILTITKNERKMKKILLSAMAILIALAVVAQERTPLSSEFSNKSVQAEFKAPIRDLGALENTINETVASRGLAPLEAEIGNTWFDLQTNSAVANRLYRWDDGSMGAVWTTGIQSPPGFPDRGTGYNYFDGTSWGPVGTTRIESVRTGWPSYTAWGPNGEAVIAHPAAGPLVLSVRENKGTGDWIQRALPPPAGHNDLVWPRMISAGENNNTLHVLVNSYVAYQGQSFALMYSRSTDGGLTWNPLNVVLPEIGPAHYTGFNADDYVWAYANGDAIAFVVGSQWHDLILMKSDDNGDTWTKTVIWEHPYPMFDWNTTITTDTLWAPDGSFQVALDNDGMAHVVFALSRVAHTEPGTTYNYWPYTDGIVYWNENMGPFPTNPTNPHWTLHADLLYESGHLIGWTQDVDGDGDVSIFDLELMVYRSLGISTMPTIHVDDMNRIFVIWSSTTETFDDGTYYYKKLWARTSPDGGYTWGDFHHITDDIMHMFDECIYPQLANTSDGKVYYHYQADETPGLALDDEHPYQLNRIILGEITKPELVGTGSNLTSNAFAVHQNFPNPVKGTTQFAIELKGRTQVSVEVYNLMGQKVITDNRGYMNTGQHLIQLDMNSYAPGMYFYTVKAGNETVTRKMIVE
jgi:hypothetical protein